MNKQHQLLIKLQTIDQRIFELRERQRKTPELIAASEAPVLQARKRLQVAKEAGDVLAQQKRDSERDLSAQEEHIRKIRGRLSELKTNKEYQAHLFEIDLAKKKKDELEESVLALMENVERNEQLVKEYELALREAEQAFEQNKAQLESEASAHDHELETLEQEREEAVKELAPELLARYAKIKSLRKGVAVVPVRDGACTGCRIQLPPQLVAEVKRGDELLSCSYCHRILYWEGSREGALKTVAVASETETLPKSETT